MYRLKPSASVFPPPGVFHKTGLAVQNTRLAREGADCRRTYTSYRARKGAFQTTIRISGIRFHRSRSRSRVQREVQKAWENFAIALTFAVKNKDTIYEQPDSHFAEKR
jgi:hypothetical protein